MAHLHKLKDSDTHYIIDPDTMQISYENSLNDRLMLGDHDSEIYTFELPKVIEGHDMSLCDRVRVHYINISSSKVDESKDVYEVKDMSVAEDDSEKLVFSWTVSGNATKYAGSLNFRILFACADGNGNYTYKKWTDVFKGITVSDGFDNGEAVVEQYSDILEQWKAEIEAKLAEGGTSDWNASEGEAGYIQNRTHWKEVAEVDNIIVLPGSSVNFATGSALVTGFTANTLEEGYIYSVNWNGTEYDVLCYMEDDAPCLGNSSLMGGAVTSDEPFCVLYYGGTSAFIYKETDDAETVVIKITGRKKEVYHKLDKNYLPDDIGGGSGGVSSWNDLTDKPFYSEMVEGEILPETTVELNPDDGGMAPINKLGLVAGQTYTVNWNGTEKEYICKEALVEGIVLAVGLGNVESIAETGDSGDTFAIADFTAEGQASLGVEAIVVDLTGATSATFSVSGMVETIHPLEKKYLPELRGQKKIVFDISQMTTSVSLDEALQMDLAELKSSIVITDGTYEIYDVVSVNKITTVLNDVTYAMLELVVSPKVEHTENIRFKRIQWNNTYEIGFKGSEQTTIPVNTFYTEEKHMLVGIHYGSNSQYDFGTRWMSFTEIGFDSIVLKSTDSSKYFRITVNDSGTITATEVEDEQIL